MLNFLFFINIVFLMISLCCDPGIRNLSICIMNDNAEILLWDTFNLLDSDDYYCESLFKNGKKCNRKCNMKYTDKDKLLKFTCKAHFPKDIKKTKTNDYKRQKIGDYLLQDIASILIKKIQDLYDSNEIFKTITNIFIELQPKVNRKSIFVSHILYGKFIDLYNASNTSNTSIQIKFISASSKLKVYKGPNITCILKKGYSKRKWLSIQYCVWFLENKFSQEQKDRWMPLFLSHSKKDDMSDTLLYSLKVLRLNWL